MTKDEALNRARHSLAHVLAQAVQAYRPGTKLGFGPAIADGFYYDFMIAGEPISATDLPELEAKMREIIRSNQSFVREDLSPAEALERIDRQMQEPHKAEYARALIEKNGEQSLSFYTNGPFLDMCEGPHVESTSEIREDCFHLYSVTAAYWRGDERHPMMTRIYGYAFANRKELAAYRLAREEQLKRDHRKLGAQLDLFMMSDVVGQGLAHWLPKGAAIVEELEKLAKEWEFQDGYERVRTPVLTRGRLFEISGHLELFRADMFPGMVGPDDDSPDDASAYFLRPMNCPHHHMVFAARPRSYRDLPMRLAEYGHTFRYERSGSLHGLTRVRAMCMNDAHIYVTEDQIREEFARVMRMHRRYYDLFEFKDYYMRLSCWDPDDPDAKSKYIDNPAAWALCEERVRQAMVDSDTPFVEVKGEAAFYGPKIDIQFKTVGLKEFTVSTCQLDFGVPLRFVEAGIPVVYRDRDGTEKAPYVIHRAPLSTHERFISFLIEHYAGAFPTWLSPVQVRILTVAERHDEYAQRVCQTLRTHLVRAEVDSSEEKLSKKIRTGTVEKIPLLLIVGDDEVAQERVMVRRYQVPEQRGFSVAELTEMVRAEIRARVHVRAWSDLDGVS